jgi:hypothetical protein
MAPKKKVAKKTTAAPFSEREALGALNMYFAAVTSAMDRHSAALVELSKAILRDAEVRLATHEKTTQQGEDLLSHMSAFVAAYSPAAAAYLDKFHKEKVERERTAGVSTIRGNGTQAPAPTEEVA